MRVWMDKKLIPVFKRSPYCDIFYTADYSTFSQTAKIGNIAIIANFVFKYICSFLLYLYHIVGKREIRIQWVQMHYILRLCASLV